MLGLGEEPEPSSTGSCSDLRAARRRHPHARAVPAPEPGPAARRALRPARGVRRLAVRGTGAGLPLRRQRTLRALVLQRGRGLRGHRRGERSRKPVTATISLLTDFGPGSVYVGQMHARADDASPRTCAWWTWPTTARPGAWRPRRTSCAARSRTSRRARSTSSSSIRASAPRARCSRRGPRARLRRSRTTGC